MSWDIHIEENDLPPDYIVRRWPGMESLEDNPIFRRWVYKRTFWNSDMSMLLDGIVLGVVLFFGLLIWVFWLFVPFLFVKAILTGLPSSGWFKRTYFGIQSDSMIHDLFLSPLRPFEIILALTAPFFSLRMAIMWGISFVVLSLCYTIMAMYEGSIELFILSNIFIGMTAFLWIGNLDKFVIRFHQMQCRFAWYNRYANLPERLIHYLKTVCVGLVWLFIVFMGFIICYTIISLSLLTVSEDADVTLLMTSLIPLLFLLFTVFAWYIFDARRAKAKMPLCQGYYYAVMHHMAVGDLPTFNPYMPSIVKRQ